MVTIRDLIVLSIIVLVIILVPNCLNLLNLGRFVDILVYTPPSFAPKSCPQTYSMPVSRRNAPEKNWYQHDISLKPIAHRFGKFLINLLLDDFLDIKKAIFHIQQQIQNLILDLSKNQLQV